MKIAVIGKGGRESAIAWKLAQSSLVREVVVFPGNPGMRSLKVSCQEVVHLEELVRKIESQGFDFVVVGQEKYLEEGLIDLLVDRKIPCVGPSKLASQLESSKVFCKSIFTEAGVATAAFKHFTGLEDLRKYTEKEITLRPLVLKWDFLAEGKGVFVCFKKDALESALEQMHLLAQKQGRFSVLVEDYLEGKEFSAFCLVDGDCVRYFSSACDYKRLSARNDSPNTGGMGAYSPDDVSPIGTQALIEDYAKKILEVLKDKGISYNGVLFFGCMVVDSKVYLLEINTRFGDPETQSLMPRLQSDLAIIFKAMSSRKGELSKVDVSWSSDMAVHVVKADPNYPKPTKQHVVIESEDVDGALVFYAGVEERDGRLFTNGGRILGLTATALSKTEARTKVYDQLHKVCFANEYYREDIGC